jgi:hypothetical protein
LEVLPLCGILPQNSHEPVTLGISGCGTNLRSHSAYRHLRVYQTPMSTLSAPIARVPRNDTFDKNEVFRFVVGPITQFKEPLKTSQNDLTDNEPKVNGIRICR